MAATKKAAPAKPARKPAAKPRATAKAAQPEAPVHEDVPQLSDPPKPSAAVAEPVAPVAPEAPEGVEPEGPLAAELKLIDKLGKGLQAKLDALWVEWDAETASGAVYWHHGAESGIRDALKSLYEVEQKVRGIPFPEGKK